MSRKLIDPKRGIIEECLNENETDFSGSLTIEKLARAFVLMSCGYELPKAEEDRLVAEFLAVLEGKKE